MATVDSYGSLLEDILDIVLYRRILLETITSKFLLEEGKLNMANLVVSTTSLDHRVWYFSASLRLLIKRA